VRPAGYGGRFERAEPKPRDERSNVAVDSALVFTRLRARPDRDGPIENLSSVGSLKLLTRTYWRASAAAAAWPPTIVERFGPRACATSDVLALGCGIGRSAIVCGGWARRVTSSTRGGAPSPRLLVADSAATACPRPAHLKRGGRLRNHRRSSGLPDAYDLVGAATWSYDDLEWRGHRHRADAQLRASASRCWPIRAGWSSASLPRVSAQRLHGDPEFGSGQLAAVADHPCSSGHQYLRGLAGGTPLTQPSPLRGEGRVRGALLGRVRPRYRTARGTGPTSRIGYLHDRPLA